MKYAIVIPDGAAVRPHPDLSGRTPLEVARIPNMDRIASGGRCGTVRTAPPDMPPGRCTIGSAEYIRGATIYGARCCLRKSILRIIPSGMRSLTANVGQASFAHPMMK